jgi:hypothetical protein
MDTVVVIDGQTFLIPNEKVHELQSWLETNSIRRESSGQMDLGFNGQNLINE